MPPKKGNGNGQEKRARRNWNTEEISKILDYMKQTIEIGNKIEKPNARAYYGKMVTELGFDCNSISVVNKMVKLKGTYDKALKWREGTGQGVDEGTVKDKLKELCPFFDEMDEIYSERVSMNPPYRSESNSSHSVPCDDVDDNDPRGDTPSPIPLDSDETTPSSQPPVVPPTKKSKFAPKHSPKTSDFSFIVSNRQEIQKEEIAVESRKIDFDSQRFKLEQEFKIEQLDLDRKRLEHKVVSRNHDIDFRRDQLKLEKEKSEREYELEKEKSERQYELEKFRIEQNVKLQIELAKINKQ